MFAFWKFLRARFWYSGSSSIVVSVLVSDALSNQSPETPAPVPASTIFLAESIAAMEARPAPVAAVTDSTPSSSALLRASEICAGSEAKLSAYFQLEILSIILRASLGRLV